MRINTEVVSALLRLRGISLSTLAQFSGVHPQRLAHWLHSPRHDEAVPFDRQLEILTLLGIRNEMPRTDLVHHWYVTEPLFGTAAGTYAPLRAVLDAFGPAEVAYLVCDTEPLLALSVRNHYALRFKAGFYAVLTVRSSPLRNVMFDPAALTHLTWMADNVAVLLDRQQYARLEPGLVEPKELAGHVDFALEEARWYNLRRLAVKHRVSPDELAQWILSVRNVASAPAVDTRPLPPETEASPAADFIVPATARAASTAAHAFAQAPSEPVSAAARTAAEKPPPAPAPSDADIINIPAFLLKARRTAAAALHGR